MDRYPITLLSGELAGSTMLVEGDIDDIFAIAHDEGATIRGWRPGDGRAPEIVASLTTFRSALVVTHFAERLERAERDADGRGLA